MLFVPRLSKNENADTTLSNQLSLRFPFAKEVSREHSPVSLFAKDRQPLSVGCIFWESVSECNDLADISAKPVFAQCIKTARPTGR